MSGNAPCGFCKPLIQQGLTEAMAFLRTEKPKGVEADDCNLGCNLGLGKSRSSPTLGNIRWRAPIKSDRKQINLYRRHLSLGEEIPTIPTTCRWRGCCSVFEWNPLPWDHLATTKEDWKAWHIQNNVECPYIPEEKHDHKPRVKQSLSTDKIDQRLEVFLLSQDFIEEISEDYFGKYRMPKIPTLLNKYNENLDNNYLVNYDPITRDQVRDAYERRFEERIKAKINGEIKRILDKILKPEKQLKTSACAEIHDLLIHYDWITEEYNPGHFFYKGTERIRQECSFEEDHRLFEKGLDYYRAKRAKQSIKEVPIHQIRTYEVAGEIKRIMFSLSLDRFYISGYELNERFKNFFLSEAIRTKRINDTPEDKQRFLLLFGQNNCFIDASFYDPTPYLPNDELKECKKYWFSVGA